MKTTTIVVILIALLIIGGVTFLAFDRGLFTGSELPDSEENIATSTSESENGENGGSNAEGNERETVIGQSVDGRDITAFHFGEGDTELLFVGGTHGGYSWNTVLVAYELMDYLEENPDVVPENVRVSVIPSLNPDGQEEIVGTAGRFTKADVPSSETARIPGRFNTNDVDLNRNFDCEWQAEGVWRDRTVSGGSEAFSEPESKALRNYVNSADPAAVVVWYSAAGGVFSSNCRAGILSETRTITNLYADASGYPAFEEFDFYEITGDMVNWLAKERIPGISVLLSNHEDVEWSKNRAGVEALLSHYAE